MRRRSVLALIAAGTAALAAGRLVQPLPDETPGFLGAFRWRHDDPRFGGLSALHLDPDGRRCLAVGDRGILVEAMLDRDPAGRIAAARVLAIHPLRGPDGRVLPKALADAEGIAQGRDGRIYISFEGRHGGRILAYDQPGASGQQLPVHPDFRRFGSNSSLEALAIDATGALYTLPEDVPGDSFPLYRFADGTWTLAAQVPRQGRFLPVGADFGPDGRLYLLERSFSLPLRFGMHLRRFRPGEWGAGEVLLQTAPGRHDNLEGLSISRDDAGRLRVTLVSDDNFLPVQRTELVEYLLPD